MKYRPYTTRRNPVSNSIPVRPILYVGAAWIGFKMAQGGAFGLPQSLAQGLGAAGGLVSKATTDTLGAVYNPRPPIGTPGGIPAGSASGGATATGAGRLSPPQRVPLWIWPPTTRPPVGSHGTVTRFSPSPNTW